MNSASNWPQSAKGTVSHSPLSAQQPPGLILSRGSTPTRLFAFTELQWSHYMHKDYRFPHTNNLPMDSPNRRPEERTVGNQWNTGIQPAFEYWCHHFIQQRSTASDTASWVFSSDVWLECGASPPQLLLRLRSVMASARRWGLPREAWVMEPQLSREDYCWSQDWTDCYHKNWCYHEAGLPYALPNTSACPFHLLPWLEATWLLRHIQSPNSEQPESWTKKKSKFPSLWYSAAVGGNIKMTCKLSSTLQSWCWAS